MTVKQYVMGKRCVVVVFIICFFLNNLLSAQISRPRRVEMGVFAGPTVDWAIANTQNYKTKGIKVDGVYGLNIDFNLVQTSSNYYFSTGINARHIRYGLEYTDNYYFNGIKQEDTALINSTFNTVYVTIPTAIKLKTTEFNRFVFWGLMGMEHGIAVSSKSNDEVKNIESGNIEEFKKVSQYKNTAILKESVYFVIGAEYIIKDNTKATFGIAYDHGLNNMFRKKYKNKISDEPVKAHTHRIEFQFGIIF